MFKKKTPSDIASQITEILFPQYDVVEGDKGRYMIDYSIDTNLQSIIHDIEDNEVDQITKESLAKLIKRIEQVRVLLNVQQKAPPSDTKYFTVLPDKPKMRDV